MFILIKQSKKRFFQCKVAILSILIILSIFAASSQHVNAYTIVNHVTCKGVDDSGDMWKPIDPTTIFYDTDEEVNLFINFEYETTSHSMIIKWYDPEDKLFETDDGHLDNPKLEGLDYHEWYVYYWSLDIKDHDAADLPGQWKVEVFIDDKKEFTEFFEIKSTTTPLEYSVSISPTSQTLSLGDTGSFAVTVTLTSGDTENVSLSLSGLPGDVQHSFSQASGTPTFTSTLTVDSSSSTSIGTYTFTVNANAAGQVKTATATLTVNEEADFSISITPPERTLNQGESTTFTVTLNEIGEFNDPVTLTASGLPTGVTPNFGPSSGKPAFTATLNLDTIESAPAGSYTVTVDASGGGKSHSVTASLIIKEQSSESTPEEEDEEETIPDDNGTNGLSTYDFLMNPRNLMLIIIAILIIALSVMMLRRGRTPTIEKTDTSIGHCTKCGAQLKPGTTFCSSCGTPKD